MPSTKFSRGKTNKHKSTQKSHTISQIASAAPRSRGKPLTTTPKGPRKAGSRAR